jgi:NAD+ synthase (glutamine-hydrolysing)
MSGGLAAISDVPKTTVYELAKHINRREKVIPQIIIDKAPSAELKPNQKDSDTLPPYEVLDEILYHLLDEGLANDEIAALGFDAKTVSWTIDAIRRSEYKRRQAPPGLKITSRAFGVGWRMPIAAEYEK